MIQNRSSEFPEFRHYNPKRAIMAAASAMNPIPKCPGLTSILGIGIGLRTVGIG